MRSQVVAIVGAGPLGGTLAHALAARDRVAEVRLVDPDLGIATGKALDIQQAAAVQGFRTRVSAAADPGAAVDASVVVLADAAAGGGEHAGDPAVELVRRLGSSSLDAVCVCAGASHLEVVERGVREGRLSRERLVGSAPDALASAVRALVALELDSSPADVSLTVLGVPPVHAVVAWESATMAGVPLASLLRPHRIRHLTARLPQLWPPGPYALASAAARVSEAAALGSRRHFSCFVVLDGELGIRGVAAALPVRFEPGGVERVLVPSLSAHEHVHLANALSAR